jgi:hypothetical protein
VITHTIEKVLSANDTGETGGHQDGILVPKDKQILLFFPTLDPTLKNPRAILDIVDDVGHKWTFSFIYYNSRLFAGTRNEYRLTRVMPFFKEFNLKSGDKVYFKKTELNKMYITFQRVKIQGTVLKLSSSWRVINSDSI